MSTSNIAEKQKVSMWVLLASSVSYSAVTFACGFAFALFVPMMSGLCEILFILYIYIY
jgi:hypothetical protein